MTYTLKEKALQLLRENELEESLLERVDLTRDLTVERSIAMLKDEKAAIEFVNIINGEQVKR